jgi:phytoene dehydrogenase-like protein
MDDAVDVVVVGGGLAGLTAAATAAAAGRSVRLLDGHPGANRAVTDHVGRFRFNRGGHALYRKGAGRPVLARLGVEVSGKMPPLFGARGRRGDVVERLPLGPVSTLRGRLVPRRGMVRLFRLAAGVPRWRPGELADRTATAWFDELGLEGPTRELVEMLARTTTYVADLDRVSADLIATQVRLALAGNVEYLHGGWETLLDGLAGAGRRHGVERVAAAARSVVPDGGRVRVTVAGDDGEQVILARAAVVAAGAPDACTALLPGVPPGWQRLAAPVQVACLDIGLAAPPPVPALFGLDRPLYLVRHAPPADLAPPGAAVVHAMRYLRAGETATAAELRAELEEHARFAGVDPDAAEQVRYLHRMVACAAPPTPETGGLAGRPAVGDTGLDGVLVAGDWVGRVGHLADAALVSGEEAGRRAAAHATGDGQAEVVEARLAAHG